MNRLTPSPCKKVCKIDKISGLCIGCYRYEYEIFNWINFSEKQKKNIILKVKDRTQVNNKT